MIVIGVDVHKHSLTAVAVDEAGRGARGADGRLGGELLAWAACARPRAAVGARGLPPSHAARSSGCLLAAGEELVRVPPKLTGPARRTGGRAASLTRSTRSRSPGRRCGSPISPRPRPGEERYRELKLLVDLPRRPRRRAPPRPAAAALASAPARPASVVSRSARSTGRSGSTASAAGCARQPSEVQVRVARDLVGRCRSLTRTILELDRELETRSAQMAPALLELPGCGAPHRREAARRDRPDRTLPHRRPTRPPRRRRTARSKLRQHQRHRLDRGGNRQLNCALHRIAITQSRVHPPARAYLERKQAEGKSRREALRCLKRQLARTVFTTLKNESAIDIGATLRSRVALDMSGIWHCEGVDQRPATMGDSDRHG